MSEGHTENKSARLFACSENRGTPALQKVILTSHKIYAPIENSAKSGKNEMKTSDPHTLENLGQFCLPLPSAEKCQQKALEV